MHLMALGAFSHSRKEAYHGKPPIRLNAPFGARCFLTRDRRRVLHDDARS